MPIVGTQLYTRKPGGRIWDVNNETGSNCESDGIRNNIEFDDPNSTSAESTWLITLTDDPESCTDKPWWSIKHGSHNHSCGECMLYEISVEWSGSIHGFRIETGNSNYGGCSGGKGYNLGPAPLNKLLGFKVARWNINNNTGVHMEYWVDYVNGGNGPWKKVGELDDASGVCGEDPMTTIRGSPSGDMQDTWRGNGASVVWHGQSRVEIIGGSSGGNPPPPPTHECPTGQIWSDPYGKCIPVCPTGYHYDDTLGRCEPNNPPPEQCPVNQHWDFTLGRCVDDTVGPPPVEDTLRFYLSGGSTGSSNTNPNLSLGGPITATQISADTMNNVWDDVGKDISSAETNYRCVYLRNNSGTKTLYNARAYLNDTDNYTGIIGNLSGVAGVPEQIIEDEETKPEGTVVPIYNVPNQFCRFARGLGLVYTDPNDGTTLTWVTVENVVKWASAKPKGQIISRVVVFLAKTGTPTGMVRVYLKDGSKNIIGNYNYVGTGAGLNCNDIPTHNTTPGQGNASYAAFAFDADTAALAHALRINDRITVDYADGNPDNYVRVHFFSAADESQVDPIPPWPENWLGIAMIEPGFTLVGYTTGTIGNTKAVAELGGVMYIKAPPCFTTAGPQKPTTYDTGLALPDIPPGSYVGIWLARQMPAHAPSAADIKVSLIVEGDYQALTE